MTTITMNQDILEGQWRAMRGMIKRRWGDLTDSDLDRIQGRYEEFAGLLQKRYGYTSAQAQQQIEYIVDVFEQRKEQLAETMPDALMSLSAEGRRTPLMILAVLFVVGVVIALLVRRNA